jgi:hypothetical protein
MNVYLIKIYNPSIYNDIEHWVVASNLAEAEKLIEHECRNHRYIRNIELKGKLSNRPL